MDYSEQGIRNFTALYVLGNVIALCSTGFLLGPRRQCKKMFHPTRRLVFFREFVGESVVFHGGATFIFIFDRNENT